ncbi:transcriptional regulator, SarA/Rot family [Streptomyces sp. S063]|uniref:transcriptional regulator, SarA/Rot family n=1 Tax=Streptomyces sp. S063 TaxID=2005885 RepID=UPI003FCC9844
MLVLWEQGPQQPVKARGALHWTRGAVALLKRLEGAGVVRRERSREDERSVVIELTDEGAGLRERALSSRGVLAATGCRWRRFSGCRSSWAGSRRAGGGGGRSLTERTVKESSRQNKLSTHLDGS